MNYSENNTTNKPAKLLYLCCTAVCLFLPLVFIYQQYDRWNPFRLKGKNFLVFYALLLLLCHLARFGERLLVPVRYRQGFWLKTVAAVVFIAGVARLIQGLYHARPVGYLFSMLGLHILLVIIAAHRRTPAL